MFSAGFLPEGVKMKNNYVFFLGGIDAEMTRIREHLILEKCEFFDDLLSWGAKASHYIDRINELTDAIPVLVELSIDVALPDSAIIIDHHGDASGRAPALIQVLDLLGIAPSRKDYLTAAMDAAYVPGLLAIGATIGEIASMLGGEATKEFEAWDRYANATRFGPGFGPGVPCPLTITDLLSLARAAYIAPEIDAESARAVDDATVVDGLIVVRQSHSKCGPVTDRLLEKQKEQHIVVISDDGEINYFGAPALVRALNTAFPGGWSGGSGLVQLEPRAIQFWADGGKSAAFLSENIPTGVAPNCAYWGGAHVQDKAVLDVIMAAQR